MTTDTLNAAMYTLGQLTRLVWPQGNIPENTVQTLLKAPVSGLIDILNAAEQTSVDRAWFKTLLWTLPNGFSDPKTDLPAETQAYFWKGIRHSH